MHFVELKLYKEDASWSDEKVKSETEVWFEYFSFAVNNVNKFVF
jgi:hypothetical protein